MHAGGCHNSHLSDGTNKCLTLFALQIKAKENIIVRNCTKGGQALKGYGSTKPRERESVTGNEISRIVAHRCVIED
jgi:hypothetical protein